MAGSQSTTRAFALRGLSAKEWRDRGLDPNECRNMLRAIFQTLPKKRGTRDPFATVLDSADAKLLDFPSALKCPPYAALNPADGKFIGFARTHVAEMLVIDVLYPLARKKGRPHKTIPRRLFLDYINPFLVRCRLPHYETYLAHAAAESETKGEAYLRATVDVVFDLLPKKRRGRQSFKYSGPVPKGVQAIAWLGHPDAKQVVKIAATKTRKGIPRKKAVIEALEMLGSPISINKLDYYLKRLSEALKQNRRP